MKKFTHGIVVVNPIDVDENGKYPVVHFVGFWSEPTETDFEHIIEELRTDPDFELMDIADDLDYYPADEECVKYHNDMVEKDGAFNTEINLN